MRHAPGLASLLLILSALPFAFSNSARAEIPKELEPDYSEAVLAFNARDYDEALQLLDKLIKEGDHPEFIELKALSLKASKRTMESASLYEKLIRAKTEAGADEEEIAPYHFELGVIRYREKRFDDARTHLNYSVENDFNEGASHFYMGLIDFKGGRWADATDHFSEVTSSSAEDLIPPAHFYLAQSNLKTSYPAGATHHLSLAYRTAGNLLEREELGESTRQVARKIHQNAGKSLAPLDRSRWFSNLTVMGGYDTNPAAFPDQSSSATSTQLAVSGGIGWMSSPLGTFQFSPRYRTGINLYLAGDEASNGQFWSNTLSANVVYQPLAPFSPGFKVETGLNFGFLRSSDEDTFALFSLTPELGPYFSWEIAPQMEIGAELFFGHGEYINDGVGSSRRSGGTKNIRLYFKNDRGRRWYNPTVSLSYSEIGPPGEESSLFTGNGPGATISNTMHFGEDRFTFSASAQHKAYTDTRPMRYDTTHSLSGTYFHKINRKLTALGQVAFSFNDTNRPHHEQFQYRRYLINLGVTYRLF